MPDVDVVVVRVVPDVSGIDRSFLYTAPRGVDVPVGALVRVNLHGRTVRAWVVEREVEIPPGVTLKAIDRVVGVVLDAGRVELARAAAVRYAGRIRPFLVAGTPRRAPRAEPGAHGARSHVVDDAARALVDEAIRRDTPLELAPCASRLAVVEAFFAAVAHDAGSVLVLVPEHRDAELLGDLLRRRGYGVSVLPDDADAAAAGSDVVVGTRNAAFAPAPSLRGVVVLDAHAEAFVAERAPTWNAAVVARDRARRAGVPCVRTSPCVPLALLGDDEPVAPALAAARSDWPLVEVIDRRVEDPRSGLYSPRLAAIVRHALDDEHPVACVLNRTGRIRLLACTVCGELARCDCGGALRAGASSRTTPAELTCASCGARRPVVCTCGSTALKAVRVGAVRAAEELSAIVGEPAALVTGSGRDPIGPERLVVGTAAVLHRLRRASLVVFLDFDQHLLAPRFGAAEEALALLAAAGRLVGGRTPRVGARTVRRLVLQTRLPHHDVVEAALAGDPGLLRAEERPRRRAMRLPPYAALARVCGGGAVAAVATTDLEFAPVPPDCALVRASDHDALATALAPLVAAGDVHIEVDPRSV